MQRPKEGVFAALCIFPFLLPAAPQTKAEVLTISVGDRQVVYEELGAKPAAATIVFLPGTGGHTDPYYREQAQLLVREGFTVDVLHYYDAAESPTPTAATYRAWVDAVQALVHQLQVHQPPGIHSIALVGYSLGASIALAAGSENIPVAGIVEWSGDLPDSFYEKLQGMPPLLILHGAEDRNIPVSNAYQLINLCHARSFHCENRIYPSEEHIFKRKARRDAQQTMITFFHQVLR